MKIGTINLTVEKLVDGYYEDNSTNKVVAWNGKLHVRPEFQREFVYDGEKQSQVINTVLNGFPLGIMYVTEREDGTYDVLDGQQRIISIARFVTNPAVSIEVPKARFNGRNIFNFSGLTEDERNRILKYRLVVHTVSGTEQERIDWFQVVNTAGDRLTRQEMRNAIYHGPWITDAKSMFSRENGPVYKKYSRYFKGKCIRQEVLETVLGWKAEQEGLKVKGVDPVDAIMQIHRMDKSANELLGYIESVFNWVVEIFGEKYESNMKGVDWGRLYNKHKDDTLNPMYIRDRVARLLEDGEIDRKSAIYEYVITDDERVLSLRRFGDNIVTTVYNRQKGICAECGKFYEKKAMQADHIIPWSKGGRTELSNCQMLCAACNRKKSNHQ